MRTQDRRLKVLLVAVIPMLISASTVASTSDQFAAFIRTEITKWPVVIKNAGLAASQ